MLSSALLRAVGIAGLLLSVSGATPVHANALRPYVVQFDCIGYPGAFVSANVQGAIQTETRYISFTAGCSNGPSPKIWPDIYESDGEILSITGVLYARVQNKPGYPAINITTPCPFTSLNGFVGTICIANPNEKTPPGRVNFNMSISPPPAQ